MTADEQDIPATSAAAQSGGRQPRRVITCVLTALFALALDVVSKVVVVSQLPQPTSTSVGHAPVKILGGVFYLQQTRNPGAAFSVGTGFTVVLTVIAVAVVVVIARIATRLHSRGWAVALGLILGGALGNLADRLFRAPGFGRGHVVDWISLFGPNGDHWPIFNLADSCIVVGAVIAALLTAAGHTVAGNTGSDPKAVE